MRKLFAIFCCCFIAGTYSLKAEEPWISGDVKARFFMQDVSSYSNDDDSTPALNQEVSNTFVELYPEFQLNFTDRLSLNNSWQFLVLKEAKGKDRFFEDQGIVLNELYVNYNEEQASFYIGKFNPDFGYAWNLDFASGIWGNDLAEQYRLIGKIGIGFTAKFDFFDFGQHEIDVATFYDDNTNLDDSMLTRRDRTVNGIGDMSDTESLSSYTVNLYGEGFWFYPDFFYNFSYRNLEGTGNSLVRQEDGVAFGFGADLEFFSSLKVKPYIEYVKINGFNSFNNRFGYEFGDDAYIPGDAEYLTVFLPFTYGKWRLHYIYSERDTDSNITANDIDIFSTEETSLSFDIFERFSLTIGRKEDVLKQGYRNQVGGMMVEYRFAFE